MLFEFTIPTLEDGRRMSYLTCCWEVYDRGTDVTSFAQAMQGVVIVSSNGSFFRKIVKLIKITNM
jgi:hypothetical protein